MLESFHAATFAALPMTLEEHVGLQLVVGLPGPRLRPELAAHLRAIHAGGFIPFTRNFDSVEQYRTLMIGLNSLGGPKPLVMVDHEGGRIIRFSDGVTRFPEALSMAQSDEAAERVEEQGRTEAEELRRLGVHMNLAPCVDVLADGCDLVIGTRSYGSNPAEVGRMAAARIRGLQGARVAACAKHFPGLGAVPKDPHKHLPTVGLDGPTIRRTHLPPFIASINAGVEAIMSSHVCYPQLEPSRIPATFSVSLIATLLRRELRFDGVVLTDDMEMGALRELCPIGEAAVRAVAAGHDMVLVCSDLEAQREVFHALLAAYRSGRLAPGQLQRSVERIVRLRRKYSVDGP